MSWGLRASAWLSSAGRIWSFWCTIENNSSDITHITRFSNYLWFGKLLCWTVFLCLTNAVVVRGGCGKHAELLPVSSWTVHLHIRGRSYSGMMTGHNNRYRLKPNNMVLHRKWICSPKDTRIIPYWRSVLHAIWAFWARHQSRFKVCIDFPIIILYHHNSWL
jgi:hypothetical protein